MDMLWRFGIYLRLVFQILSELCSKIVPDLNESIHASCDKVLAIGRKHSTFCMLRLGELLE